MLQATYCVTFSPVFALVAFALARALALFPPPPEANGGRGKEKEKRQTDSAPEGPSGVELAAQAPRSPPPQDPTAATPGGVDLAGTYADGGGGSDSAGGNAGLRPSGWVTEPSAATAGHVRPSAPPVPAALTDPAPAPAPAPAAEGGDERDGGERARERPVGRVAHARSSQARRSADTIKKPRDGADEGEDAASAPVDRIPGQLPSD